MAKLFQSDKGKKKIDANSLCLKVNIILNRFVQTFLQ